MKKLIVIGLAAAATLASCSYDDTVEKAQNTSAIGFSNFVDKSTRSIEDPSLTNSNLDEFLVYGYMGENLIFDEQSVTLTDGEWSYTPVQYWVSGNVYYFVGVAPASVADGVETELGESNVKTTISFTNDGETDLIYAAPNEVSCSDASNMDEVEMTFDHMLSKVKFSFNNNTGSSAYYIKVSDIKITDAYTTGELTCDGTTEDYSSESSCYSWGSLANENLELDFGAATSESATSNEAEFIPYEDEYESYNELLLIPTDDTKSYTVTFTATLYSCSGDEATEENTTEIAENDFTTTISSLELKMGYCYDFLAELTYKDITEEDEYPIEFTVTNVNDWNDDEEDQELDLTE